ncbi:MAG: UDP-N-acetylmuramoyl-L-alanine--D-glutamate ligase, partial [Anaerolineae bacterium]|nr:UDP-N-acetylmuramoyl-L-alanine--D-glutamate ligase [Anaerolineae bacterium]
MTASDTNTQLDLAEFQHVANLKFALGGHPLTLLDECDLLCLSGGVPIDLPIVLEAKRRGIPLSNDAQIFAEACPAPIIGITGSAGKTTT